MPLFRLNFISQYPDAFYFHFDCIARLHGCNTLWRSGDDDIAWKKRHIPGNIAENFLNAKDTIFGIVFLLEFAVKVGFQRETVGVQIGHDIRAQGAERVEPLRDTQQEGIAFNHVSFGDIVETGIPQYII